MFVDDEVCTDCGVDAGRFVSDGDDRVCVACRITRADARAEAYRKVLEMWVVRISDYRKGDARAYGKTSLQVLVDVCDATVKVLDGPDPGRAARDEVRHLRERLSQARHFVIDDPGVCVPIGEDGGFDVLSRIEIGRANDGYYRVVGYFVDDPRFAPFLGRDGVWYQRPEEESADFSEATAFPDAESAFAAVAELRSEKVS